MEVPSSHRRNEAGQRMDEVPKVSETSKSENVLAK